VNTKLWLYTTEHWTPKSTYIGENNVMGYTVFSCYHGDCFINVPL